MSQAKAQADQLLAETKADAERRRAAAQRDVDELTRQKDSIATHLAQVRQLLGGQLLPGMDAATMQAPPAKPAIAAESAPAAPPTQGPVAPAAPAAPASAPRNGNGGSAPPTAVQPAQSASHQATQVSSRGAAAARQRRLARRRLTPSRPPTARKTTRTGGLSRGSVTARRVLRRRAPDRFGGRVRAFVHAFVYRAR